MCEPFSKFFKKIKKLFKKVLTNHSASDIIRYVVGEQHRATTTYVGVAQLDRAFGYGPKGREFESSRPR